MQDVKSMRLNGWQQWLAVAGCSLVITGIQIPALQQLTTQRTNLSPLPQLERSLANDRTYLDLMAKLPSLGFDNLVANWFFLAFLQYFGDDEARRVTDYRLSPDYFDVIIKNDPRFLAAYFFLSGSTSLYAGQPDRTIAIMESGSPFLKPKIPDRAYLFWRYKGTDQLLFLGDTRGARSSFETAANWADQYTDAESPKVAQASRQTAAFLQRNPNSRYAQFSAWLMVLANVRPGDTATRQRVLERIRATGGDVIDTPNGPRIIAPQQD